MEKDLDEKEDNFWIKIKILEAAVMPVVKFGSKEWALQKKEEDLLDFFQGICLRVVLGIQLTNLISKSNSHKKSGSVLLSRAITRESYRRIGHVLRMMIDRLQWTMTDL